MENLIMFLATSIALRLSKPKFKRYLISTSGCSALLVAGNKNIQVKRTPEGDRVLFYDQNVGESTYGLICVQMKELFTLQEAEKIAVHYVTRIRRPFGISFNLSMKLEKNNNVVIISDYWQDENGMDWKIKACTDGKTLAVLYVKNIGASPVDDHDAFLNGFRFSRFS